MCERVYDKTVNEPFRVCVRCREEKKKSVCGRVLTEGVQLKACACPYGGGFGLYLVRWPIKRAEVNPSPTNLRVGEVQDFSV